jgi:Fur family transcriptional regulator, ferric uptake regulator
MTQAPKRQPLPLDSKDEVLAALRAAGHRLTTPGRLVVDALHEADGPVSADDIAATWDGRGIPLATASVYRNLERLQALGIVEHVHAGHGAGLYALASAHGREHLVCDGCGKLTSVAPAALEPVRAAVREAFAFEAEFGHFPIHGLCADCAAGGGHGHDHAH